MGTLVAGLDSVLCLEDEIFTILGLFYSHMNLMWKCHQHY